MACWVYVLLGSDGKRYVGVTKRLQRRIREHNAGRTPADRNRGPFTLLYREKHPDYSAARLREKYLKSGEGRAWLDRRLKSALNENERRGVAQSG